MFTVHHQFLCFKPHTIKKFNVKYLWEILFDLSTVYPYLSPQSYMIKILLTLINIYYAYVKYLLCICWTKQVSENKGPDPGNDHTQVYITWANQNWFSQEHWSISRRVLWLNSFITTHLRWLALFNNGGKERLCNVRSIPGKNEWAWFREGEMVKATN